MWCRLFTRCTAVAVAAGTLVNGSAPRALFPCPSAAGVELSYGDAGGGGPAPDQVAGDARFARARQRREGERCGERTAHSKEGSCQGGTKSSLSPDAGCVHLRVAVELLIAYYRIS